MHNQMDYSCPTASLETFLPVFMLPEAVFVLHVGNLEKDMFHKHLHTKRMINEPKIQMSWE